MDHSYEIPRSPGGKTGKSKEREMIFERQNKPRCSCSIEPT